MIIKDKNVITSIGKYDVYYIPCVTNEDIEELTRIFGREFSNLEEENVILYNYSTSETIQLNPIDAQEMIGYILKSWN